MERGIKMHEVKNPFCSLFNSGKVKEGAQENTQALFLGVHPSKCPHQSAAALTWPWAALKNKSPCCVLSALPLPLKGGGYF